LRIVVHDYSGHPFQVQLSRELARQGHDILHLYSASFETPKGGVLRRAEDPDNFCIEGLSLRIPKYDHFVKRRSQEIRYGKLAAARIALFRPDLVLSANTPLDAQAVIQAETRRLGARFAFWLQDVYSEGIGGSLRKLNFPGASAIGLWYRQLERRLLRASDAVIAITPDFVPLLDSWKVRNVDVIENWAPRDELRPCPQDNPWSRAHDLAGKFVFLYSGTLGLKHNPSVLLDLAAAVPDSTVAVLSEGANADWLRFAAAERSLTNFRSLPLQPYELMPEVLSTGSVLMAILDEDAGAFSVPSKVLSYLCVGRPLLLSVPAKNAAARLVWGNSAGLVVPPSDSQAFALAGQRLRADPLLRERCGDNALRYAGQKFDIERIGERFAEVLNLTSTRSTVRTGR
jgi:colanic acid biosynthesis glycosyl transferase WcaI